MDLDNLVQLDFELDEGSFRNRIRVGIELGNRESNKGREEPGSICTESVRSRSEPARIALNRPKTGFDKDTLARPGSGSRGSSPPSFQSFQFNPISEIAAWFLSFQNFAN